MNIQEYIATGILEAYLLGEVSEQERAEIEENLVRHPELREELQRIEKTQDEMVRRAAVTPSAGLGKKILGRAGEMPVTRLRELNPESSLLFWRIATAASVSLGLIASYFVVEYRSQLQDSKSAFQELLLRDQQMAQEYSTMNDRLERITGTLNILDNPSYTRIILQGTEASPESLVSLFWNQRSSEVFVSIQHLGELPIHQQFQLWAIVDGKPVDAGVFDLSKEILRMKDVDHASAFAITIEQRGGSEIPTLSAMQAIGKTGV